MPPFDFVLVFAFSSRPPAAMMTCGRVFDVGFPSRSACFLLQVAFHRLATPAKAAVRGSFLTVVCLIIAHFSSRPPATLAVRRRFLTVGYLILVSSINFLPVFPGFITKPLRGVAVGFRSRSFD